MRALRNPGTICSLRRLLKELKACHGRAEPCGTWLGVSEILRPLCRFLAFFSFPLCAVAETRACTLDDAPVVSGVLEVSAWLSHGSRLRKSLKRN